MSMYLDPLEALYGLTPASIPSVVESETASVAESFVSDESVVVLDSLVSKPEESTSFQEASVIPSSLDLNIFLAPESEPTSSFEEVAFLKEEPVLQNQSVLAALKKTKSGKHFSFFKKPSGFNLLAEIKTFSILFILVFTGFFFFTNAKLVAITIQDSLSSPSPALFPMEEEHSAPDPLEIKAKKIEVLEGKFASLQAASTRKEQDLAMTMKEFLDKKQETHRLEFNTLPPTNRLIIPDLNINVPLIDVPAYHGDDFSEESFDDELMSGVVKYPTTPAPGNKGNALLFGHTSTEWWKKNEYGFVFRNIPKLQVGQRFQVVWNGQLTTYEMVERKVVLPSGVADYYHEIEEKGGSFVTLMGCYPIGTADKRIMVVAKKVAND